ncbi:protein phosphatase 2A regulatory B subunit [Rhizoctonia solani AG-1 IA]|uniref:Protein phosphatase PP2A regulatory subunit B n=1 Tax=Thanatephorus cucumeris (strain AG1-IA) TaxID=983506 RepID=L8X469_THACA|nr:protein phosphatase 2A regulatory B subunit [Rhizoctonia solani AG-1 IA]
MDGGDSANSSGPWRFAQCFGDKGEVEDITEGQYPSSLGFDNTGDYLATGDKGGRVVLFERNNQKRGCEYKFYTEFQSHEPEFDYLKSLEIEEKINRIKWCKRQNAAHFLLSTNDKTIKLWKVHEKTIKQVSESNLHNGQRATPPPTTAAGLKLPRMTMGDAVVAAIPRKVYANAHAYHINSISINSDGETYISADDLSSRRSSRRPNSIQSTAIPSCTRVPREQSSSPICATKHYAMDMQKFEEEEDPSNRSFFSEIISSISDVKFSRDGRYILSRDYLSLKIWDMNMDRRPVKTINIHDHLRGKLCDLYENDCIFDKFECSFSGDGSQVMTGSYHNYFRIYDVDGNNDVLLQADKSAFRANRIGGARTPVRGPGRQGMNVETIDFNKKILHGSWHPRENTIAIAATNNLFLYSAA